MTKNKQVSALLIAALLATGVATTASARDGDMRGMRGENRAEMFNQLDTNGNGSVSAEEFEARRQSVCPCGYRRQRSFDRGRTGSRWSGSGATPRRDG